MQNTYLFFHLFCACDIMLMLLFYLMTKLYLNIYSLSQIFNRHWRIQVGPEAPPQTIFFLKRSMFLYNDGLQRTPPKPPAEIGLAPSKLLLWIRPC